MRRLKKLLRLLPHASYRRALRHGTAAAVEHSGFLSLKPFATIIDAGANKGQFSLAARAAQPDALIVAFEPLPGPADTFRKVFADAPNIRMHPFALGASSGAETIHVSGRPDSSSLLPISELQDRTFPGTAATRTEVIELRRLDELFQPGVWRQPILLKIDVQGFELNLLKGAVRTLHEVDTVYVELSFVEFYEKQPLAWEVTEWFAQRGFGLSGVYNVIHDARGQAIQADCAFERVGGRSDYGMPSVTPVPSSLAG